MVIFLFSDSKYEQSAINCIRSFEKSITDDIKVVYYTVGFDSSFSCKNLHKIKIGQKRYPSPIFYKPELSLLTLSLFPNEKFFLYSDTDIIYSSKFNFSLIKEDATSYPLAPIGPFDHPYIWENVNGVYREYRCDELMEYLNVPARTMKYVNSCFYLFGHECKDFLEEWHSLCANRYLHSRPGGILYFPFQDEASLNVLLWKRKADKNLGRCYLNTQRLEVIKKCELSDVEVGIQEGGPLDALGKNWEYVEDSSKIIFYHGIKETQKSNEILDYIKGLI